MTRYLLPCPCSHRNAVGPGQAGGSIRCGGCNAELAVPKLGELGRLEIEPGPTGPTHGGWNASHAWMLAGCLILVGGLAAGGWLRGRREAVAPLNEPALRAAMAAAPAAEVHASWLVFEREGLVRPPLVEEQRRLASARAIAGLEWIAWLTAAVGAAVATGAALLSGRSPRRSAASRA